MGHIVVASFKALPDKYGGKSGENKCLDKCYQYFNKIIEYYKND
jgi:hypothetical protein